MITLDIKELANQIRSCNKCRLSQTRQNTVVGRGNGSPDIVFIGEAPGKEEDKQGRPFCGPSGKLLDAAIEQNGIKNYAIVNIVKCRPPSPDGKDRKPTPDEISACSPWLEEQLRLLNPKIVVLLGATALNYFYPKEKITQAVKKQLDVKNGIKFVAMFHPAYVLRGNMTREEYIKSFDRVRFFPESNSVVVEAPPEPIIQPPQDIPLGNITDPQPYVPLHCHSEEGSIGDVFRTTKEFVQDLKSKGFRAAAITDHGSLSGTYYFQKEMKAAGLQPIIGLEGYIKETGDERSHVILLVKNEEGYKNLLKIHNIAKSPDNYYKGRMKDFPRIPLSSLYSHSNGLICMSACTSGLLAYRWKKEIDINPMLLKLQEAFGPDFFLEVMPNRLTDQVEYNKFLLQKAKEHGIKLVITTDSHYNNIEDKFGHDIIETISFKGTTMENPKGFGDNTFCNLTGSQIETLIKEHHPDLLPYLQEMFDNTIEIASKCEFNLPERFENTLIGDKEEAQNNILNNLKLDEYIAETGRDRDLVYERAKKEIDLIFDRGYAIYYDTAREMIEFARNHGIPVGPGRGSAGGSFVAYQLQITRIDPFKYGTLFERFLSPTRVPDIDTDFSSDRREEVIGHLKSKFGFSNVVPIITFGTWEDAQALRDADRIYKHLVPRFETERAAKELTKKYGEKITIEKALQESEKFKTFAEKYPEVVHAALLIKGKIRQRGTHAAGIVICKDLPETIPTEIFKGETISSWEKDAIEGIGITKFDILGVTILDILDEIIKSSNTTWNDLPTEFNDPKVFELFKSGKTAGIFQFGTDLLTGYLKQLKPTQFSDLIAANALCRPGSLRSGMAAEFVKRKNGSKWFYDHPSFEPIMKDTLGIFTFQEQIMRLANEIGGFTMPESEKFLKLVSKSKGKEAIAERGPAFKSGALKIGLTEEDVEKLFSKILEFGAYSFNLAHACAYSINGYLTAWLKVHYPLQTYVSLINHEKDEEKVSQYLLEALNSGIRLLPPSIKSPSKAATFNIKENAIYMGLNKIKGIGPKEAENILSCGKNFTKIRQKAKKNVFQTLVEIGYFDSIEPNRKALFESKDLTQNTLIAWSEDPSQDDWSDEEKLRRLRQYMSWPRDSSELPLTEYDDFCSKISSFQGLEVENTAVLIKGWVCNSKSFKNNGGETYFLELEDGSGRTEVIISPEVAEESLGLIRDVMEGKHTKPILVAAHPFFFGKSGVETREGKVTCLWIGTCTDKLPLNIKTGLEEIPKMKDGEYVVTNIRYGTSKTGNKYANIELVNNLGNRKTGITMLKNGYIRFGNIVKGHWTDSFFNIQRD